MPKRDLINTVGGLPIFSEKYFTDNKVDFEASTLTPALGSGPYILDKVDVGKQIIYKKIQTIGVMISQLIKVDITSINLELNTSQIIIRRSKVLKLVHILSEMKHPQKYGLQVMIFLHWKRIGLRKRHFQMEIYLRAIICPQFETRKISRYKG